MYNILALARMQQTQNQKKRNKKNAQSTVCKALGFIRRSLETFQK